MQMLPNRLKPLSEVTFKFYLEGENNDVIIRPTLSTLAVCVFYFLPDQTPLRSLHLPKNNSLYVLTPDIAPSASTSKNRWAPLRSKTPLLFPLPQLATSPTMSVPVHPRVEVPCSTQREHRVAVHAHFDRHSGRQRGIKYRIHCYIKTHLTFPVHIHFLASIVTFWAGHLPLQSPAAV